MQINCTGDYMSKDLKREFIGGLTTFLTMSYIIIVNPSILGTPGTGMSFSGVMTATVILCFICTLLMGLYANLPFAVAPGMGLNAFFTYTLILGQKIPWPVALGMVFWSGIIFLFLSLTPIREGMVKAIPISIRHAASVGIGLFLTFIGFKNAGIIQAHPVTLVTLGNLNIEVLLVVLALIIIGVMMKKNNRLAFLSGILFVTVLSLFMGKVKMPEAYISMPDFQSVLFKLDIIGALKLSLLPPILSIMFTDLFDSLSTFMGLSQAANLLDEHGEPKNVRQALIVDAIATTLAGILGTSAGTAYIESAAGIEAGGRTGLSSIFTAFLFLPFLFLGPLVQMVPIYATAPVLIVVGFLMFKSVTHISFAKLEEALPAFLTMILIPLTFSITEGLILGLVSYVVLHVLTGKRKEISLGLYTVAAICLCLLFVQGH